MNHILRSKNRNPTVDVFRGIAILLVVLYHFNYTIYMGSLGVDLFFVISGLLVGGLLVKDYKEDRTIRFRQFFLKRGFKIWPSYYFFLFIGGILGYMLFHNTNPEQIPDSWSKYIFFWKNYHHEILKDGEWIYSHAWSLCIEEHFYILLPIMFILVQRLGNLRWLCFSVIGLIAIGIISKVFTFYFTKDQDTYFPTHNRIDGLAWGVLLTLFINYSDWLKRFKYKILAFLVLLILFTVLFKYYFMADEFFKKVVFRSVVPILFAGMIGSLYYIELSFLKPLRVVGYYSYNWYLWHPIIAFIIIKNYGTDFPSLLLYLSGSFIVSVVVTILIEEPFLRVRGRLFAKKKKEPAVAPATGWE